MPRTRRTRPGPSRPAAVALLALLTALGLAGLTGLASPAAADPPADPPAGFTDWYAWADAAAAEAAATDWAALARRAGCVLEDVEIRRVVDAGANAATGAPADLAVTVVEREETCTDAPPAVSSMRADGLLAAGGCASTHGPGTVCIGRSGSFVTTSFRYQGERTVSAYLRVYDVARTSGCPTGTTVGSSATQSYGPGTQRSLSVSAPTTQGYAAHVWRYVALGSYTDWGAACGVL